MLVHSQKGGIPQTSSMSMSESVIFPLRSTYTSEVLQRIRLDSKCQFEVQFDRLKRQGLMTNTFTIVNVRFFFVPGD